MSGKIILAKEAGNMNRTGNDDCEGMGDDFTATWDPDTAEWDKPLPLDR